MASPQEDNVSAGVSKKKILDLRVVDLRAELDKRGLDKAGVKVALIERLTKALASEGKNVDDHLFEVAGGEVTPAKKIPNKRVNKKLTNESESTNNSEGADETMEVEDDEKAESDEEKLKLGDSDEEKEDDAQDNEGLESSVIEDETMEEPLPEPENETLTTETTNDHKGGQADEKDSYDDQTSPPKPELSPVVAPFNVNDTINLDTSCALKSNDNASLIVHVDDTQSDLDGDLDTSAGDLTNRTGKETNTNVGEDGKLSLETSSLVDDDEQEEEEEEGEEEEEEEANNENSETVTALQGDDDDIEEITVVKVATPVKETSKVTVEKKGSAIKEKKEDTVTSTTTAATTTAVATPSNASSSGKESKETTKAAQEAETGGAASAPTPGTPATNHIKSKSVSIVTKEKAADKDEKVVTKKQVVVSSRNLWVSGLSTQTRATDLKTLFSKFGKVIAAKIVTNSKSPGGHCYGFITMSSSEEASKCIQHLHRTELHGKMISVEKTGRDPLAAVRKTEARKTQSYGSGSSSSSSRHFSARVNTTVESRRVHKAPSKAEDGKEDKSDKSEKAEASSEVIEEKKEKTKTVVVKESAEASSQESSSKDREKSRDKSREKSRDRGERMSSRGDREIRGSRSSHPREFRPRMMRPMRPFLSRRMPRGMMPMRSRFMGPGFRKPFFIKKPFTPGFKPRSSMLTFQKIKVNYSHDPEERLRQRQRERDREIREGERRRVQEIMRQKDIERKQREESIRLDRERERLRVEREKLERERADILRLEREKQKIERERIEREREELSRRAQITRFDEPRRVPKRPYDARGLRDTDTYWEERKKPARYQEFEHREKERIPFERHEPFERRSGGAERFEPREKVVGSPREFEIRRDIRRPPPMHEREAPGSGRVVERTFERGFPKEEFRGGRGEREIKGSHRGGRGERMGPPRISRPSAAGEEHWKSGGHDRRVHDAPRGDRERYADSGKNVSVASGGSYSGRSYGGSDREHSWSSGGQKSYSGAIGSSGAPQWGTDSRKVDSAHWQSGSSQGERWSHGIGMEPRNSRQQGIAPPLLTSTPQSNIYSGSGVAQGGSVAHSGISSSYSGDRFMAPIRRY